MNEIGTVYAIRHKPTGRIYVGSTGNLEARIATHMSKLRNHKHPCRAMQADFDVYGDNYDVAILYQGKVGGTDLTKIESAFMSLLKTRNADFGYNSNDHSKDFDLDDIAWIAAPKDSIAKAIRVENPAWKETRPDGTTLIAYGLQSNEIELLKMISAMPNRLKEKFIDQANGALLAMEAIRGGENNEAGEARNDDA